MRYGLVMSAEWAVWYFRSNIDLGLVGGLLGGVALGYYGMAVTLARLPLSKLTSIVNPVAFPVLARSQHDQAGAARRYLAISAGIAFVVFPLAIGLACTATDAVPTLLGSQWLPAAIPTVIIALIVPLQSLSTLNATALKSLGMVQKSLQISIAMAVLTPLAIIGAARAGIIGIAVAVALVYLPVAAWGFAVTWHALNLSIRRYARVLWPVVSSTLGMSIVVILVRLGMPMSWFPGVRLIVEIAAGAATYAGTLYFLHRVDASQQLRMVREAWRGAPA